MGKNGLPAIPAVAAPVVTSQGVYIPFIVVAVDGSGALVPALQYVIQGMYFFTLTPLL